MSRPTTPSQTIGPFFHRALLRETSHDLSGRGAAGERVVIEGRVLDGDGAAVGDAMIEIWQANAAGRYDHPEDLRDDRPLDEKFHGFGRAASNFDGSFSFRTIKPGPVPGSGNSLQAPHINVSVFARGLLKRLVTRIYFPGEPLNSADPLLNAVPPDRRTTLIARAEKRSSGELELFFNIVLQGDGETVFLDI